MEFGKIISQALKITWQQKFLWLFAALPMLIYLIPSLFYPTPVMPTNFQFMSQREATQFMSQYMAQVIPLIAIQCLIGLVSFAIAPISVGGIIKGIQLALLKKKLDIRRLFQQTLPYYWRLFLLPVIGILIGLLVAIVMVLVIVLPSTLLATSSEEVGTGIGLFFLLMCCLYIALFVGLIFLGVLFSFSYIGIVVNDLGVGEAISRSWSLIRTHFGHVFAATIIYGFIGLVIFAVFYAIYFGVFFTVGAGNFGDYEAMIRFSQGWLPKVFAVVIYAVFSVITVFFNALWVQTYQALREMPTTQKAPRKKTAKA